MNKTFKTVIFMIFFTTLFFVVLAQEETIIEGSLKIDHQNIQNPEFGTIKFNEQSEDIEGYTQNGWVSLTKYSNINLPFGSERLPLVECEKRPTELPGPPTLPPEMMGSSVDISGNYAVVGAHLDDNGRGAVFVLYYLDGKWSNPIRIVANDGTAGDHFGWSVAIDGTNIIVGAPKDDDNGISSGSAYIFTTNFWEINWQQQQKITANNALQGDNFGWAVDIQGDKAIVTANQKNNAQGTAYAYIYDNASWTEDQILTASNGQSGDRFGWSVAIDNGLAVIGAITASDSSKGSAYVYRNDSSSWIEADELTGPDGMEEDRFGRSVSISNSNIAIGAYKHDANGPNAGAVYTFEHDGGNWNMIQKLTPSNLDSTVEYFGWSVAQYADYLVVGSHLQDVNAADSGSAYLYQKNNTSWELVYQLVPSDGVADNNFGFDVGINGPNIVIVSPSNIVQAVNTGAIYFY